MRVLNTSTISVGQFPGSAYGVCAKNHPPDGGWHGLRNEHSNQHLKVPGLRQAEGAAHTSAVLLETILGLGAAHELGHLHLGENPHSPSGSMKAKWGNDELNLGSHGN